MKYLGLSEATADEIRQAHAIHPISAVQLEWSLWTRNAEVTSCRALFFAPCSQGDCRRDSHVRFTGRFHINTLPLTELFLDLPWSIVLTAHNPEERTLIIRRLTEVHHAIGGFVCMSDSPRRSHAPQDVCLTDNEDCMRNIVAFCEPPTLIAFQMTHRAFVKRWCRWAANKMCVLTTLTEGQLIFGSERTRTLACTENMFKWQGQHVDIKAWNNYMK